MPIPLHAANPGPFTGAGNWTYLFPGPAPVLFDAGVGHPDHVAAIAAAAPHGPARVIVSHAHPDHATGAPALAARWPDVAFSKVGWPEQDDPAIAWRGLADGDMVHTDEGPWQVLHTPGHAPDHVVLWDAGSKTLLGADLMQLGNTVSIPAEQGGDLTAYLRSLRRVQALAPARVLPAHGAVIDEPLALIEQYLKHRHQREVQVLSALEAGLATVTSITDRIYAGLSEQLVPLARQSVLAHLIKLEHDGLARRDGDRWRLLT
ncbi:MAG TPA: MBL fold metallo-hydrolase [Vicinamibacterales bacterium]|nr:MBL fold metallo-hydrolase [Vicinamibacterales bacterium]